MVLDAEVWRLALLGALYSSILNDILSGLSVLACLSSFFLLHAQRRRRSGSSGGLDNKFETTLCKS